MPKEAELPFADRESVAAFLAQRLGRENMVALAVAADTGSNVARTFGLFARIEKLLLSPETVRVATDLRRTRGLTKDKAGRRVLPTHFTPANPAPFFSLRSLPEPALRRELLKLSSAAPTLSTAVQYLEELAALGRFLSQFYQENPERRGLFGRLKNSKHMLATFALEAARQRGIAHLLNATELAALAVYVGEEEHTATLKAKTEAVDLWRKIKKRTKPTLEQLKLLPALPFQWGPVLHQTPLVQQTSRFVPNPPDDV